MASRLETVQDDMRVASTAIDRLKDAVADRSGGGTAGDVRAVKAQQTAFKQLVKQQVEPVQKQVRVVGC